jgi:hypothetical protein
MAKVVQAQNQEPVAAEIIAQSIVKMADGFDRMNKSGLSLKAIMLLVSNSSGVCQRDVKQVLLAMSTLKRDYLVAPKTTK